MTESGAPDNAGPLGPETAGAGALRREIRALVRKGRQARGLTQTELGQAVGVSRFTINRIEMGALEVSSALADRLQRELGLSNLALLVAQRDRLAAITQNERDLVARRLLTTPSLERLRIVLADDLDLYGILFTRLGESSFLSGCDVQVVVPTIDREYQLFGHLPLQGHFEYQIRRLIDLHDSDAYPMSDLQVFESDLVLGSCIIAGTRTGTECAYWPVVPVAGVVHGNSLPVATTLDPNVTSKLAAHVDDLIKTRKPLQVNEALCRIVPSDPVDSTDDDGLPIFTRYFNVGLDQEEDVDVNEGFALALVLPVALCPRKHHGIARRVITYKREVMLDDRQRISLFSKRVEDADIRAARSHDESRSRDEAGRSTQGALSAALDINEYLTHNSGVVPERAYRAAARREFAMYGVDIDPGRLTPVPLPPELRLVEKHAGRGRTRAALAPQLYTLELSAKGAEPELATLQANADVEELGVADLMETVRLNDFLSTARECGFLEPLLRRMGVAER